MSKSRIDVLFLITAMVVCSAVCMGATTLDDDSMFGIRGNSGGGPVGHCLTGQSCGQEGLNCGSFCQSGSDCRDNYYAQETGLNSCKPGSGPFGCDPELRTGCGPIFNCECQPFLCLPESFLPPQWQGNFAPCEGPPCQSC